MGVLGGLAKGVCSAAVMGYATSWVAAQFQLPYLASWSLTAAASVCGLLCYARVWIQGYYFDAYYTPTADLGNRTAVVTGGTVGGLGFAAAELLALMGATVIVTCRSDAKGKAAVQQLKQSAGHDRISYVLVDFMSCDSVKVGAANIASAAPRIDILVLNAGIARSPSLPDGDASVWMTNHLGPFIFTECLKPTLKTAAAQSGSDVRVVSVSSGAHKGSQIHWADPFAPHGKGTFAGAYGQSKLANIMHIRELQRRLRAEGHKGVRCFAVTPGAVWTNIMPTPPLPLRPLMWAVMRSPTVGAQVIKMACVDPDLEGGEYLSNCAVKDSEGADSCSKDEAQWAKLWELSERQSAEARFS
eukprot:SAG11_NODE_729_length_7489_cov_17.662246_1_plen_358_part_00